MSLDKKYNIPPETIKRMLRDGVISCSISRHYEVYEYYLQYKSENPMASGTDINYALAEKFRLMPDTIRKIITDVGKKS